MTTLQEAAMRKALELGKQYAKCLMMNQAPFDEALESLRTALAQQGEPIGFMSPKQVGHIQDRKDKSGIYIPMRKTAAGLFTLPIYTAAPAPQQDGTLINEGTKSAPAPQPARGGAELIARATKVASELDDFNASLDRKAAKCIRELLSALQSAQSVVAQPDHIPDAGEMVPLTDDRVIGLLAEHGCIGAQSKNDFVAGLRYGEAAHGIGVGNTIGK